MMKLKVLASSSKGNCYILEAETGSLLLECGIPFKDIQKGLNFNLSNVCGCLVTHAHKDHSKAIIEVMKNGIDTWTSIGTVDKLNISNWAVNSYRLSFAKSEVEFSISDFDILPFAIEHDCIEPLGYLIYYRPTKEKILFITDTAYCKYKFSGVNYIMVECNYCLDILNENVEADIVDLAMKQRLIKTHFSLEHVKQFLLANDLSQTRQIVLTHLSDTNSDAERMQREVFELTGINTTVASTGFSLDLQLYPY